MNGVFGNEKLRREIWKYGRGYFFIHDLEREWN